jgi:hypothetical protein
VTGGPERESGGLPQATGAGEAFEPQAPAPESSDHGNGSHEAPTPAAERAPVREYHAEPRESSPAHEPAAPLAHFEPTPRHEGAAPENKPYVIWSSAPSEKTPGGRGGPEE